MTKDKIVPYCKCRPDLIGKMDVACGSSTCTAEFITVQEALNLAYFHGFADGQATEVAIQTKAEAVKNTGNDRYWWWQ